MHQQNGPGTLQPPRRCIQPEESLYQEGGESALAIEKQKGEHADERRKHRRQGNQTTHDPAARKVVAGEEERERDPDCSGQHHRCE